jgi:hypothetical protein
MFGLRPGISIEEDGGGHVGDGGSGAWLPVSLVPSGMVESSSMSHRSQYHDGSTSSAVKSSLTCLCTGTLVDKVRTEWLRAMSMRP